jgi:hypothetical protein
MHCQLHSAWQVLHASKMKIADACAMFRQYTGCSQLLLVLGLPIGCCMYHGLHAPSTFTQLVHPSHMVNRAQPCTWSALATGVCSLSKMTSHQ